MTYPLRPQLTGLPVLETERLVLRGPQPGDWPTFRDYRAWSRTAFAGGVKKKHDRNETLKWTSAGAIYRFTRGAA